jgi:MarR family transcriptional regulator, organic hydroperoxide resistance regulator
MTRQQDIEIESIVAAQRAVIRALHAASPSWLELNLTMAQLKTLIVLHDEGPLPIGQVGYRMGVTLPTASYQVDRLVRAGLVERVEDVRDRRRTLVHLTSKADELVRSLRQGRAGQLRSWLIEMSPEDLRALDRGLSALAAIAAEQTKPEEQPSGMTAPVLTAAGNEQSNGDE